MATIKATIIAGKKNLKKDGTANVKIRITHLRNAIFIKTDLFVNPSDFKISEGLIKKGPNKKYVNLRITELLLKYQLDILNLGDRVIYMTGTELKKYLLAGQIKSKQVDFLKFIEDYVSTVKIKGTAEQYLSLMASLKSFVGDKLPVSDIRLNFLYQYENYLRSRNVKNGIINYT